MIKQQLYEPYSVSVETLTDFPRRVRQNAFFELVYILSGTGKHSINDSRMPYQSGEMYLLGMDDRHCFGIETTTTFFFLRFNDIYIKNNGLVKDNVQRLEFLLQNANQRPGPVVRNETDRPLVHAIVEAIIREQVNRDPCCEKLILGLVNALIVLVARNIEMFMPEKFHKGHKEEKAMDIIQYIHTNIFDPEKLKAEHISGEFGISLTYLGRYFKKQTGKTLQDYIANYRLKLVENRLLHSAMRISEIVDELGFSDESHLNKFFRKHKGANPSEFRKAARG
jgi:AraC-like DNA-binding protein